MNRLTEIRAGLGASLAAAFAPDYQVVAFMIAAPTPPGFQIAPDRMQYHEELGDPTLYRFIVIGATGYAGDLIAQQNLDQLLDDRVDVSDPPSVREALEADQRLSWRLQDDGSILTGQPAACDDVTVVGCSGYRLYPLQDRQQWVLGAEWEVEVRT